MATKYFELTNTWTLINKGGVIPESKCIIKVKNGDILISTTEDSNPPIDDEASFLVTEGVIYTNNEYLWAKAVSGTSTPLVIDKIE